MSLNRFAQVLVVAAVGVVLVGCGRSGEAYVIGAGSAATPSVGATETSEPSLGGVSHRAIMPGLEAELRKSSSGDEVIVTLNWSNTSSDTGFNGVKETRVIVPKGLELVAIPNNCKEALSNDVVCEFRGYLPPGGTASRTLAFSISKDMEPGTTLGFADADNTVSAEVTLT